jgi:hypothetical protein
MLGSKNPIINLFLKNNSKDLEELLNDGNYISSFNDKIRFKPVGTIQDTMAIPKVLNTIQFNGKYGCIHCLNPGKQLQNIRKRDYLYTKTTETRTNEIYKQQVEVAIKHDRIYEGIKGSCWIMNFISIPDNVIIDFMHVTCIGTLESMLKMWLNDYKTDDVINDYYMSK